MYITNNDQVIWGFPQDGGDQSAQGLYQIPEILGVGVHLYIAFDQHKVLFEQNYEWQAVNPKQSRFDAQLLTLNDAELNVLEQFVSDNTQQATRWQKLRKKKPLTADFVCMVEAVYHAAQTQGLREFYLYQ